MEYAGRSESYVRCRYSAFTRIDRIYQRERYENSVLKIKDDDAVSEKKEECACVDVLSTPILFTRNGCPNCKTAKMMLDKNGFIYSVINAEEDKDTTIKYGVKKAPTLLVQTDKGIVAYDNASEIRKYIESVK